MLANYVYEQEQFRALVESDADAKILMFQGESGTGKSFLIDHCLQSIPGRPNTLLKLQNGGDTITSLFDTIGRQKGWDRLINFTFTVGELLEEKGKVSDRLWQVQMRRHLREISRVGDVETRYSRYRLLTDAWFADASEFETPHLLVVDSYEKATTEFGRWFSDEFLYGVAGSSKIRVLIGGQRVPEMRPDWSFCASLQKLAGIADAREWLVWAEHEGYQVPPLEDLSKVIAILKGRPSDIVEIIKSLSQKKSTPFTPKASDTERRKDLHEKLRDNFNLDDLRTICFYMRIDFEELPEQKVKSGVVRELLLLVERLGRLQELITICRQERPQLAW